MFSYTVDDTISLKLIELSDANSIYELVDQSRTYLRQWLPWVDGTTKVADSIDFIRACQKAYVEQIGMFTVIMYNGKIIGTASYNSLDWRNKIVYIGYWLAPDYQGQGIMTKVVKALTTYAFEELQFNRVDIRAATSNVKSRSIPERLGFIYEGTVRDAEWLYDHYVDHAIYGVLARDWQRNMAGMMMQGRADVTVD
ncbi:N-acetyltransferase [Bacillus sp. HMF5848]|uniref:GNAT family N-acetyltransferase n=1 Tax=Bacillus sp. HMF5848 TaxID=2495421 RepID=UPI000F76F96E|nr:GNAT family protein [Bacillus sp. HMF5848]RSK28886.1 N-acetyltransferase [Bacillus sp. HMF5848]